MARLKVDTGILNSYNRGTTSLYNYIYCTVAGFTENDTFSSNQIKEGMLTREEALNLVTEENRPRYETIK